MICIIEANEGATNCSSSSQLVPVGDRPFTRKPVDLCLFAALYMYTLISLLGVNIITSFINNQYRLSGLEFRQKIYLSDGQVDLQNHLSVMKSTCPTQKNHKIKRIFNVAP